nr:12245_t:CDS:2 [Entrophospora candida]
MTIEHKELLNKPYLVANQIFEIQQDFVVIKLKISDSMLNEGGLGATKIRLLMFCVIPFNNLNLHANGPYGLDRIGITEEVFIS